MPSHGLWGPQGAGESPGSLGAAGGRWAVSQAYSAHSGSVEDLQWSPTEGTVFASASSDRTLRIWDSRDRAKAQICVTAHEVLLPPPIHALSPARTS